MIYFLGILALIVFSVLMFPKQVKINLIRMKHGRYSYRYVKQFKKYANKSPFPYCFKDEIMPYLRLSSARRKNTLQLRSDMEILFEGTPYHTNLQDIIKRTEDPGCFNVFMIKNEELRAFGYQKQVFGCTVKAVYFFLGQTFVMGEYIIDDLSGVDIANIAKQLLIQTGTQTTDNLPNFIIDGENKTSVFFYENGFSLIIRYSDLSNDHFNELIK
jgi:hypothetical protein